MGKPLNSSEGYFKHVELLDYIRGVAIIAVMILHTIGNVFGYDSLPWNGWVRDFSGSGWFVTFFPITFSGHAGVPVFFVVSGFCIHMSFQKQGCRWSDFFIRRFFRIYPAYLVALFFSIIVICCQRPMSLDNDIFRLQFFTHLFLVHNFHPSTVYGFAGAFWSLAVEMQLYLIYPVLLWLVAKLTWRNTLMLLAGCEIVIHAAQGLAETFGLADTIAGRVVWLVAQSPLGFWLSWAIGARIADALLKNQPFPLANWRISSWLGLALVCYLIKPLAHFEFLMFAMAAATMISQLLGGQRLQTSFSETRFFWLKKVGLWSYSIYLLHQPLLQIYTAIIYAVIPIEYRPEPIAFLMIIATWSVIIPISLLWYKIFECPGIALGKNLIQRLNLFRIAKADPTVSIHASEAPQSSKRKVGVNFALMGLALLLIAGGTLLAGKLCIRDKFFPTPDENNNRAWALATNSDPSRRDGLLAVKLAEDACLRTQYGEPVMIGTLAAAFAEAGRFEDAVVAAQKARDLAAQKGETNVVQKNLELMELYKKHQPYHERQGDGSH